MSLSVCARQSYIHVFCILSLPHFITIILKSFDLLFTSIIIIACACAYAIQSTCIKERHMKSMSMYMEVCIKAVSESTCSWDTPYILYII